MTRTDTIQGLELLLMLASENTLDIVNHGGLDFAIIAVRCCKARPIMVGLAARLCHVIMVKNPETRTLCVARNLHLFLFERLAEHSAHSILLEEALRSLKTMTFRAPSVRRDLLGLGVLSNVCDLLHQHRDAVHIVSIGLSLLCNLTCNIGQESEDEDIVVMGQTTEEPDGYKLADVRLVPFVMAAVIQHQVTFMLCSDTFFSLCLF